MPSRRDTSRSRHVETSLTALLEAVGPRIETISARLDDPSTSFWIYGSGGFGRRIAHAIRTRGGRVSGFLDRNLAGKVIDDAPVMHPDRLTLDGPSVMLLGLFNPLHAWTDPLAFAWAKGFADVLTPIDLADLCPELATYWMTPRAELLPVVPSLAGLADLLADDVSIDILKRLLSFRLTGNPDFHPEVHAAEQYLPRDFRTADLAFPRPITFVDGGAFTGDTGLFLASQGVAMAEWIAFEPDLGNFTKLVESASRLSETRCSFFPLGLSDRNEDCAFDSQDTAASRVGGGSATVRCVAIDTVLAGVRPDYIKLDIEGAEDAALRGMAGVLQSCRPALAISAYHKPSDLIDLAERVLSILPNARMYLRQHAESCFDTVLYAFC